MRVKDALSVGIFALATGIAMPAYAQDKPAAAPAAPAAEEEATAPDIVVTAQFRETKLQDTPLAITAVNAALLEQRAQTNISDVAAQAPNVTLKPQPQNNGIGLIAFIRGVGQTDFNYALEPGVGIYIDDVYIPTLSSSMLDLMDLERIEILRGPQGTLAGKNSIGGAIKLFSSKPDGTGKGSLQVTYGQFNRLDIRGYADFALGENLYARVSGVSKSRDGYVTLLDYGLTHPLSNVKANNNAGKGGVLGTLGGQHYTAGRVSLRWVPNDSIELNVAADYTNENDDSGAEVLLWANSAGKTPDGLPFLKGKDGNAVPANCQFVPYGRHSCDTPVAGFDPQFVSYSNFLDARDPTTQAPYKPYAAIPGNKFEGWGVMSHLEADINDNLKVDWIQSYRHYDSTWGMDQDSTPVPIAQLNQTLKHHAWSQEVRLNGKVPDLVEWTLGGFYFEQDGSLRARVDLNYAGIDFIHGPDTTPSSSKAVFFTTTWHPAEGFNINAGVRHSWDKKTYTYFRSNPDGSIPGPGPCAFFLGAATAGPTAVGNAPNCLLLGLYNISDSFQGERTDWRLSADYRFNDSVMAYAQVSTGYKGGGVNPRPFFGPSSPNNQLKSFQPETLTTYEVGFKTDLFDRKVRLNGALFFNKYNDIILTLTACPTAPCLQPNNVGKADVKGAELEATIRPFDGLVIDGSWSYIDLEYKTTSGSAVPITAITPYTPQYNWSLGMQYDYDLGKGTLAARIDTSYQSHFFTEAANSPFSRVDSRFLANASLRYTTEDKEWQVALEVQNLLNRYYMLSVSDVNASLGVVTGQPGLPRTWAVTIKRNFR